MHSRSDQEGAYAAEWLIETVADESADADEVRIVAEGTAVAAEAAGADEIMARATNGMQDTHQRPQRMNMNLEQAVRCLLHQWQ